ncbi:MAG: di-trans,poly-cis-decaprenylcistransferase [Clostridia bacterium]|nr:di-trans,poly-cis-decaprenylcistransferase [Clostridia bacterium]
MKNLKIPKHIGIILDGNGRWAKKRHMPRTYGHKIGVKAIEKTVKAAIELNVNTLSVFAFSTENWSRPKEEINTIFSLIEQAIDENFEKIVQNNIKIRIMGDISALSLSLQEKIKKIINATKKNSGLIFNVAINYGARDEILKATANLIAKGKQPTKANFEKELYSSGLADLDLVIRTSGEQRLSNFMLYQSAYAELYFPKVYWPDFNKKCLIKAIKEYSKRERRFGNVA